MDPNREGLSACERVRYGEDASHVHILYRKRHQRVDDRSFWGVLMAVAFGGAGGALSPHPSISSSERPNETLADPLMRPIAGFTYIRAKPSHDANQSVFAFPTVRNYIARTQLHSLDLPGARFSVSQYLLAP